MSLNAFDATKHDIGLGPNADYGFMLVGAYAKDGQRGVVPLNDFGGDEDLIGQAPNRSRWTQDDFSGGAYQSRFEKDAAMFYDCRGWIPSQQSRSVITVPPMVLAKNYNAAAEGGNGASNEPLSMFAVAGSIFTAFPNGVLRYIQGSGATQWFSAFQDTDQYADAFYERNTQDIFVLCNPVIDASTTAPGIGRMSPTSGLGYHFWRMSDKLAKGRKAYGFDLSGTMLILGVGLRLWTAGLPADPQSDHEPVWTEIGRLPGRWIDSCSYNGNTYILCGNADQTSHIVAFDGQNVVPVTELPYNFQGHSMKVYGGRLYVGGGGTDLNGGARYAELHEITGSSARMVRSWEWEHVEGHATAPVDIPDFIPSEGFLFFPEKGHKLIAYDLTTDGFFGACEFQNSNLDIRKMCHGRERIYGWGVGGTTGLYRVAIAGHDTPAAYSPTLVTSDFTFEPAMDKQWSEIVTLSRFGSPTLEYSQDGGFSWTSLTTTSEVHGDLEYIKADLSALPVSKAIRFRFTVAMGTNVDAFVELIAYTVQFTFLGTDKHAWTFTINAAEHIEGRDGVTVTVDCSETNSTLWDWWNNKTKLQYRDWDGVNHNVTVFSLTEQMPIVGPLSDTRPESYYAVTLVEV